MLHRRSAERDPFDPSDVQQLAREHGIEPDPASSSHEIAKTSGSRPGRHVLGVRTNLVLIAASACGTTSRRVQTFGSEFAKEQYRITRRLRTCSCCSSVALCFGVLAGGYLGRRARAPAAI